MLDWTTVRSLGELRLLSRASIFSLILVPVLATVWPGVRLLVSQYNRISVISNDNLKATSVMAQRDARELIALIRSTQGTANATSIGRIAPANADSIAAKLERAVVSFAASVDTIGQTLTVVAIPPPVLPLALALLFFGSLFVVLGQVVYQSRAPTIVRNETLSDFVRRRALAYAETPTKLQLVRALTFLERLDEAQPELSPFECRELIEAGASKEYRKHARSNAFACLITLAMYGAGVTLLVSLMLLQSYHVATAAGWTWLVRP